MIFLKWNINRDGNQDKIKVNLIEILKKLIENHKNSCKAILEILLLLMELGIDMQGKIFSKRNIVFLFFRVDIWLDIWVDYSISFIFLFKNFFR